MLSTTTLPPEVQILIDRQAIMDCLVTYCRGIDRGDRQLLLTAFHDDAMDDHGIFCGDREAFADWAIGFHTTHQTAHHHYITNHTCELNGDVAHTETYFFFSGVNRQGPTSLSGGRYVDRLEKRDGRWAIADRKCLIEWAGLLTDVPISPEDLAVIRSSGTAARDHSDPSYERPLRVTNAPHTVTY